MCATSKNPNWRIYHKGCGVGLVDHALINVPSYLRVVLRIELLLVGMVQSYQVDWYMGEFCMTVDFCSLKDNFRWQCTSFYGPNSRSHKSSFWEEIRGCEGMSNVPRVICGDFNAIFVQEYKAPGTPNLEDIRSASSLIQDLALCEPLSIGRR